MKKLWKVCRRTLALLLAWSLVFGLCINGLTAIAAESTPEAHNDDILKDFFGEDMTAEEAYEQLLTDSAQMEDYQNRSFQYVTNKNSFYVALGDETGAITKKQTSTYVNLLADALNVSYKNLTEAQMPIQNVYNTISSNADTVAKADLITVGFSNFGATFFMCQYMAGQVDKVTEKQWIDLVGKDNLPKVQAVLNQIFKRISDQNIAEDQFGGFDLEGGLECYIYTYMSNSIHLSKVVESIRVVNPDAAIVIVGTYNDLDGISLSVNGSAADLGGMMNDLVNSSNYLALKVASSYDRVTYVDAKDVATALDANASKYTKPNQYVMAIVGRQGLPNADGHAYIKDQILSCISKTCEHTWNDGVVQKEPTCKNDGTLKFTCTWCGETKQESIPATGDHVLATREENRKEATCAADGSYDLVTYCTGCGWETKREKKTIPATGNHSFGSWKQTKAPTCTEAGEEERTCKGCGLKETRAVAATGHNYTAVVTHPTCTEDGYTTYTCACGDSYVSDPLPALGHAFDSWTQVKAPTCTEKGEEQRSCKRCGHIETREVDMIDHAYEAVVTDPTCTEDGYTTYTCACGHSYVDDKVAALGHDFGEWTLIKAPTCTEKGEEQRTCARCNETQTREVDMIDHAYEAVVTDPTCTEDGYTTYTCACGYSYIDDKVEALGHDFGEWTLIKAPTCTEKGEEQSVCSRCGQTVSREVDMDGHKYEAVVTEPTCTEDGYTTYTCACGDTYIDDNVPALGHDWVTIIQDETCCEDGLLTQTCNRCGEAVTEVIPANGEHDLVYTDNEDGATHSISCGNSGKILNANEQHAFVDGVCQQCGAKKICKHLWNNGEVIKAPTCMTAGEKQYTCELCGETYVEILEIDPEAHTGVTHVENAETPTCEAAGYTGDTVCECGVVLEKGQEIPMTGHTFGEWIQTKAPTCTEKGEEERVCSACGKVETREIAMIAHAYDAIVTEPTCTEGGYTTYVCACGESYVADKVDALGHDFGEWTQVKAPTCTEKGQEQRSCSRCDETESRQIAMIAHEYEAVVTAPTCTDEGYTTYTCVCGDTYIADEVSALGHNWMTTTQNETCCEAGLLTHTCSLCGEQKTENIPANGEHDLVYTDNENGAGHSVSCRNSGNVLNANELHAFVDDVCQKCGAKEICKHQWNEGEVTKAPTCCATGEKKFTCSDCGEFYVEILPVDPEAHTGVTHLENAKTPTCKAPGYTGDTVCECGVVLEKGEEIANTEHTFGDWFQIKAPTCTEKGEEKRVCAVCAYAETSELEMIAHAYQAVVTKPTCTEEGYTTYICVCGDSYLDNKVDALGHAFGAWTQVKAPTCTEKGQDERSCIHCDETETREVEMIAHAYQAVVTKPTCTEEGFTTYTCTMCDYSYVGNTVAALGHAFGAWTQVKAPTCTEKGQDQRSCIHCDETESREVEMIAHEYQTIVTNPTCTEGGYTTYTCTMCGASYVSDHTEALSHSWDAGVVTKEPTATEDGVKTFTCTVCGATKTEVIDKLGGGQGDVDYELPEDGTVSIPENDCFEGGTTVKVEQVEEGEIFDQVQDAMDGREESYVVFEFTATKDGVDVQPDGKLTVTFAIPAGYSINVVMYYMNDNGKLEQLQATVDADARTITVELAHFSTYILADKDTAPAFVQGDANGDGRVTVGDARAILRYMAGLTEDGEVDEAAADFNGDGRVTVGDARAILRHIAGQD